jgi:hypothetical protein
LRFTYVRFAAGDSAPSQCARRHCTE